jgi:hypothetical protein
VLHSQVLLIVQCPWEIQKLLINIYRLSRILCSKDGMNEVCICRERGKGKGEGERLADRTGKIGGE